MITQRVSLFIEVNVFRQESDRRTVQGCDDRTETLDGLVSLVVDDLCLVVEVFVINKKVIISR